jgi:hypothetical protein
VLTRSFSSLIAPASKVCLMLPVRRNAPEDFSARAAERDLLLWTTRDGREIPLDDMTDDHIANAIRVLTLWRSRAKQRDAKDPILMELRDAIERFKRIQRSRRKATQRDNPNARRAIGFNRKKAKPPE